MLTNGRHVPSAWSEGSRLRRRVERPRHVHLARAGRARHASWRALIAKGDHAAAMRMMELGILEHANAPSRAGSWPSRRSPFQWKPSASADHLDSARAERRVRPK